MIKEFQILSHTWRICRYEAGWNVINRLEDITSSFELIDLGLMGHTHRTWVATATFRDMSKYNKWIIIQYRIEKSYWEIQELI